jgi:hypothetical protein
MTNSASWSRRTRPFSAFPPPSNCPDEKTAAEKKGKIIAEFKAKYADRLAPDGGYALTVATGGDSATGKAYVEVDLETTAFKSTVARNNAPAK